MSTIKEDKLKELIKSGFELKLISLELNIPIEELMEIKKEIDNPKTKKTLSLEEINQIKNLIKNGFDIELISSELGISIEAINKIKEEIISASQGEAISQSKESSKLDQMRERYMNLYYNSSQHDYKKKELSDQDIKQIELGFITIQKNIDELREIQKKEDKKKSVTIILKKITSILQYELTIEQAKKIMDLLRREELNDWNTDKNDNVKFQLTMTRKTAFRKLIEAIDTAQSRTEDIAELQDLKKKLMESTYKHNISLLEGVIIKIDNKISRIIQQRGIERLRKNLSQNVRDIITQLVNGTLKTKEANAIIDEEVMKRSQAGPQNKFALTKEQHKWHIFTQIKMQIKENSNEFYVINPEKTISLLAELTGISIEQSAEFVIDNLVSSKRFETAKTIFQNYFTKAKKGPLQKNEVFIYNKIINAEFADLVLKTINMHSTIEEKEACFRLIENGIKRGNIKPKSINLGKSQDGVKTITLADIWEDEIKIKNR